MAPLTRARPAATRVPNALMAEYYAQRASAGLIISEATGISREGLGWPNAPGLWNDAQVEGWKPVTDAVHQAGGRIVAQLWHMGRLVHPDLGGGQPVSLLGDDGARLCPHLRGQEALCRSARAATHERHPPHHRRLCLRPRATRSAPASTASRSTARTAIWSINSCATARISATDEYGGSIDNRLRFMTEVLEAVGDAVGMDRVGIRFSPNIHSQGVEDSDPIPLFTRGRRERLEELNVPWIELREAHQPTSAGAIPTAPVSPAMRPLYSGTILLNSDYDGPSARGADGRGHRRRHQLRPAVHLQPRPRQPDRGAELRSARATPATYYSGGAAGYVDYPALDEARGRLGSVLLAQHEQGERGAGRMPALVALGRIGADDRLGLVLDGEDAVADREALERQVHQRRERFRSATSSK